MKLPNLGRRHDARGGRFSPFDYAIGLDSSLDEALDFPAYPLPQPVSDESLQQFVNCLAFFHEAAHLSHHVSTSVGLHMLRLTIICYQYLQGGNGWNLPVIQSTINRPDRSEYHDRSLIRFLSFLDVLNQVRLDSTLTEHPSPSVPDASIARTSVTWSPYAFIGIPLDDPAVLERLGIQTYEQPVLIANVAGRQEWLLVNAAVLSETFAFLVELNHVINALQGSELADDDIAAVFSSGGQYYALLITAAVQLKCDLFEAMFPVTACIDLAFMYDPFVLYNSSKIEISDDNLPPYRYPGEVFVAALDVAERLPVVTNFEEFGAYYAALCKEMGVPSPEWMVTKALERATSIQTNISQAGNPPRWMSDAIDMHVAALELRLKDPLDFPRLLHTSNGVLDVFDLCTPHITVYDRISGDPLGFNPKNVDLLTVHNLISQSLLQDRIDCPLKQGTPFYCPSTLSGASQLCVFLGPEGRLGECLVDRFERTCRFQ